MTVNPKTAAGAAKVQLALVSPAACRAEAAVLENGAAKYGLWNWRESNVPLMTYLHAMKRHIDAVIDGEDTDQESCQPHLAHVRAGTGIVLDALACGTLVDDRPPAPRRKPTPRLPDASAPRVGDKFRCDVAIEVAPGEFRVPGVCTVSEVLEVLEGTGRVRLSEYPNRVFYTRAPCWAPVAGE